MTEKDLALRHADAAAVELDLEDALAAEASRTGTSTGEATAVLRTLPADARRRLPLRLRLRVPVLLLILMIAVAGGLLYILADQARDRTQRGTGTGVSKAPPGEQIVSVKRTSANDYDPLGDDNEHSDEAFRAVDQDPGTSWTTEHYTGNKLTKPTGEAPGVGLYVDAEPSVNGKSLEIQTPNPGWTMEIYGTRSPPPSSWPSDLWTKLGGGTVEKKQQTFKLDTGDRRYRYYLVWITALPPEHDQVAITQLTLSAPKS
jgi:eukaryotic-like serine/threonine-protein kinase